MRIYLPKNVEIEIETNPDTVPEIEMYLADVLSLYSRPGLPCADYPRRNISVQLDKHPSRSGMRQLEPGVLGMPNAMLDKAFRVRIDRTDCGHIELRSPTSALEWLLWVLQLVLLERRSAFVHSAGVVRNGQAVLFPSWGGVGKTAITKEFVSHDGWQLLGDDLVIVSSDGICSGFPRAMVLYPYHRDVFPEVFQGAGGPIAPAFANEFLTAVGHSIKPILRRAPGALRWARRHNPQSVRIAPSKVFGSNALTSNAVLDAVVWIERDSTLSEARIENSDDRFVSRIVGTTLSEFTRHCTSLTPTLFGLGVFSYENTYGNWHSILEDGLQGKGKWMLSIPTSLPVAEVPSTVKRLLASVGILD